MHRKFLFVINRNAVPPGAEEALRNYFHRHGQPDHLFAATAAPEEAFERIGAHVRAVDGIVTLGGDGTFRHALNAVDRISEWGGGGEVAFDRLIFGALRGGSTGNDIGVALGMGNTGGEIRRGREPESLRPVLEAARGDIQIRAVDVGYADLPGRSRALFFNILGAGFDALVVERAKAMKELWFRGGRASARLSYFYAALRSAYGFQAAAVKALRINGLPVEIRDRIFMTAVMNLPVAAGGLTLNPYGIMGDGSFELTILGDFSGLRSKPELINLLLGAIRGKPDIGHPKVTYFSAAERPPGSPAEPAAWTNPIKRVEIEFERPVPAEADGDLLGAANHIEAGICPFKLNIITGGTGNGGGGKAG